MTSGDNKLEVIVLKNRKLYTNKLYIILVCLVLLLTNCTKDKEEIKFKKKDKAPDSINDVSDNIQDILKNIGKIEKILDGTYIEEEKEEEKEKKQEKQEEQEMEESKTTESDSEEKEGSQNGKQDEETKNKEEKADKQNKENEEKEEDEKNEDLKRFWENIENKLESVHEKWNDFESEGTKRGMTDENANEFRNSLNDLTKSIENKNIESIYNFGAECFSDLSPIFNLYKDELKGEINKIKYAVYKAYLMGMDKDIDKGKNILEDSEKNISLIRAKIKEDDKEKIKSLEKLNLSILDMKKSFLKQSIKLNRIKRDIIIKNLEEFNN